MNKKFKMKTIPIVLFAVLLLLSCRSGPSEFVSEENGIKITFPCSYEKNSNGFICGNPFPEPGNLLVYSYSVIFNSFDENQWNRRLGAIRASAMKASSDFNSPSYTKDVTVNEVKIKDFRVFEEVNKTVKLGKIEEIKKILFIIKNGKLIEIVGFLRYHPELNREEFDKLIETEFKGFFDSLELN